MSATSDAWPIFANGDTATPLEAHLSALGLHGVYRIADEAERVALIAALAAESIDTTILYAHRLDADEGGELEVTTDGGTTWRRVASGESDWTALTLATDWAVDTGYPTLAVRNNGDGTVTMRGTRLVRTSSLAVSAGVGYTVATLTGAYIPTVRHNGTCAYGASGNLGSGPLLIGTTGDIQPVHWSTNSTITTAGGVGNSVWIPTQRYALA